MDQQQQYPYYGVAHGNVVPLDSEEARIRFEKNGDRTFFSLTEAQDAARMQLCAFARENPLGAAHTLPMVAVMNLMVR